MEVTISLPVRLPALPVNSGPLPVTQTNGNVRLRSCVVAIQNCNGNCNIYQAVLLHGEIIRQWVMGLQLTECVISPADTFTPLCLFCNVQCCWWRKMRRIKHLRHVSSPGRCSSGEFDIYLKIALFCSRKACTTTTRPLFQRRSHAVIHARVGWGRLLRPRRQKRQQGDSERWLRFQLRGQRIHMLFFEKKKIGWNFLQKTPGGVKISKNHGGGSFLACIETSSRKKSFFPWLR